MDDGESVRLGIWMTVSRLGEDEWMTVSRLGEDDGESVR